MARANPFWGYSNSSGAFRAELWRERPFREDMPGTEDKEWAWHWLQQGRVVVVDPTFATEHSHRDEGPRQVFARARNEWAGYAAYLDLEPYGSARPRPRLVDGASTATRRTCGRAPAGGGPPGWPGSGAGAPRER